VLARETTYMAPAMRPKVHRAIEKVVDRTAGAE
jgi:hypothetical protein